MPIPQKPTKEIPKTARERVYLELRQWIIDGTLKPDEKISDHELSEYFSVSRTPVREAMQLLADQKLIDIYPGRESRVSPIDFESLNKTYKLTAELHALAIEFAFPHITNQTITELKKINHLFSTASKEHDIKKTNKYDQAFHGVFLSLSDNYFLNEFTKTLNSHIERIENLYYSMILDHMDSISEHEQIIKALEDHNLPLAMESMKTNWLHTLDIINEIKK